MGADAGNDSGVANDAGANFIVYSGAAGVNNFPADYSFAGSANYQDTTSPRTGHPYDLGFTATSAFGGWLPATVPSWGPSNANWYFDGAPFAYLQFDLMPRVSNGQAVSVYLVGNFAGLAPHAFVGDANIEASVDDISKYGPTPLLGVWGTYRIPLNQLGVLGQQIYKFALQDHSGSTGTVFLVDNVQFVRGTYSWVVNHGLTSGWVDASTHATVTYTNTDLGPPLAILAAPTPPPAAQSSFIGPDQAKLVATAAGATLRVNHAGGFNLSGFTQLALSSWATQSGQQLEVQLYDTSGSPVGSAVNPYLYGVDHFSTRYSNFTIPLSAFGAVGTTIGGLSIKDLSGGAGNTLYVCAVAFTS